MTNTDIYKELGQFLLSIIPEELKDNWNSAELNIEIQPGMLGFNGNCFSKENRTSLKTRTPSELRTAVKDFHTAMTKDGTNKWNKAKFTLYPDHKFDLTFIWDEVWQKEVDDLNKKEEKRDPKYSRTKWPWEI